MATQARINPLVDLFRPTKKKAIMRISDYIDPELIAFLDVDTRDQAIDSLIDILERNEKLPSKEQFRKAIFYREELVSTGIGMGVAVPHAKIPGLTQFFIAIGIQQKKGLEWNALDKTPVRFIFMIGGPDNKQSEYLQILSLLTSAIKEPELRKRLLKAAAAGEVLEIFSNSL